MKKARMLLVVLFTFSLLSTISAQTVDLTFQAEITQEYNILPTWIAWKFIT
jgi:hypothetical protein